MNDEQFNRLQSEFWKRFNRAKRAEKRLILETLAQARSEKRSLAIVPLEGISFSDPRNIHVFFDGENYDFEQVIERSKRINPSLYRKYQKDVKRYEEIYGLLS